MGCLARQKERAGDKEVYRCVNRTCPSFISLVDEEHCSQCSFKKERHSKEPCCPKPEFKRTEPLPEGEAERIIKSDPEEITEKEATREMPGLPVQMYHYQMALRKWQAAGRPVRPQEEVTRLHDEHCVKCDWFENGRCKGCGCKVSMGSIAIFNKLKMATEHCPKELW